MVGVRKDEKAIPFPRRLSRTEIERFWWKLTEDVDDCGEIMPTQTQFMRCFGECTYDSFNEAKKYYGLFKNSICRGEEPKVPEKFIGIRALGETLEDEILIVAGRLYSSEKNCSSEAIIEEVNRVRGIRPSMKVVKEAKSKGISLKNEKDLSWYMIVNIPKECLEKIIGEVPLSSK